MSRRLAAATLSLFLMACSTAGGAPKTNLLPAASSPPPIVYAAVGASETLGIGARDPRREAWPQVFYRTALPASAVFYDFGVPGETVAAALRDEVPEALSVQPDLVTVWLNFDDIVNGVPADQYGRDLDSLIVALRQGGRAEVLVANTPALDRLPAYLACAKAAAACPVIGRSAPPPDVVNAIVASYNAVIARVATAEGAILVDLAAGGEVPDSHPDWVSSDGFHPSTAGHAAIASTFATAVAGRLPASGIRGHSP